MKRRLMRVLFSVVASALLLLALTSNAKAQETIPVTQVAGFQLKGLGNYRGKFLTVYYAEGKRASINTQSDQIEITEVKAKNTLQITGDSVVTPAVSIPRIGFYQYNIVVFVIHSGADFRWVNADGSAPDKEATAGATAYDKVDSLTFGEARDVRTSGQAYQFGHQK